MQGKRIAIVLGLAALLVLAGGAYAISHNFGSPTLTVDEAYFVERGRDAGGNVTVEAVLFMSNRGGGTADGLRVTTFVIPQRTGLAIDTTAQNVNPIRASRTSEVHLTFQIPKLNLTAPEGYTVQFLVFEESLLTLRGSGSVGYGSCCFYGGGYAAYDESKATSAEAGALRSSAPSFNRVG